MGNTKLKKWSRVRAFARRVGRWLVIFVLASVAAAWAYGQFAHREQGPTMSALPVESDATLLDRTFEPILEAHPGQTGMTLFTDNLDAFAIRVSTARAAERSLDLQYYLWHDDLTGRLLLKEVLAAADRGVRVRVILDDINAHHADRVLRTLETHRNIYVRMFNPSRGRGGGLRRGLELILRGMSLNRRMHNKCWLVDGRIAVVGGRNIGDEYFDAATTEANFLDTDLALVGRAVVDTSAVFDSFWNSETVIPIGALSDASEVSLDAVREQLRELAETDRARTYLDHAAIEESVGRTVGARHHWSADVVVRSDPPNKAGSEEAWLVEHVVRFLSLAESQVEITSPYFVPGDAGVEEFRRLRERDVEVAVLTNSLAATDVSAVHSGYARYRESLLSAGVELFELMPTSTNVNRSALGSSGASLHTKAFTLDDDRGFVGSLNFDPRSASLNTEMGCFFRSTSLVAELRAAFARNTSDDSAYRVSLEGTDLRWEGNDGTFATEPQTTWWDRALSTMVGWLPIESQL